MSVLGISVWDVSVTLRHVPVRCVSMSDVLVWDVSVRNVSVWEVPVSDVSVPGCCLLLVGCLTSQQHTTVSQGQICSDN